MLPLLGVVFENTPTRRSNHKYGYVSIELVPLQGAILPEP